MANALGDTNRAPGFSEGEALPGRQPSMDDPGHPHPRDQASPGRDQQPQAHPHSGGNTPQQPARLVYPQPQGGPLGLTLSFDMGALLRTQVGCVKILEFFVLGTAWAAALKYDAPYAKTDEQTAFFLGATISTWAITVLSIVNTIFGGTKDVCHPMDAARFNINIYIVLDILLAISSSIMAKRASDLASIDDEVPNVVALYVAVGFGYLSFCVILADLLMYCREYTFYRGQEQHYQQFQNQPTYPPQQYGQYGFQRGDHPPASVISFPTPQ